MGMDAELLAIGKYTPEVKESLGYPSSFYDDTPVGSTVITVVGNCTNSEASKDLATALKISPWQFQEHCGLSGENADLYLLSESLEGSKSGIADFIKLRQYGFRFYYLPNG